ncbi:MAG: cobalamin biosynthesis protein CobD [Chloroflexi bacterium]|nr:cobalamin biosynthesis protein CobD [Chloroflexota bacterium]
MSVRGTIVCWPLAARALALALDLLAGEPPAALHPVVWLGRLIGALERRAPGAPLAQLAYGGLVVAAAAGVAWGGSRALLHRAPWLAPYLLKSAFAWRALRRAGLGVAERLERGDLHGARLALQALVSRETADLDAPLVAAAAIESLAENLGDGLVAPLLYDACGGVPLALAYRAVNTCDAMLGYRGRYEHLGKLPARLDDLLNLLPARLSALLLAVAAGRGAGAAWRALRDAGRTPSPNAGWPMSAAAGALGVALEKRAVYRLNPTGGSPTPADVRRAVALVDRAAVLAVAAWLFWWWHRGA